MVDFNLEHTYYTDAPYHGPEALRNIVETELKRGRFGTYDASMENFKFEQIDGKTSSYMNKSVRYIIHDNEKLLTLTFS